MKKSETGYGVLGIFVFLKSCMKYNPFIVFMKSLVFLWLYQFSLQNPYFNRAVLNEKAGNEGRVLLEPFLKASGRRS